MTKLMLSSGTPLVAARVAATALTPEYRLVAPVVTATGGELCPQAGPGHLATVAVRERVGGTDVLGRTTVIGLATSDKFTRPGSASWSPPV